MRTTACFALWQGVPIRIKSGPKIMENQRVILMHRATNIFQSACSGSISSFPARQGGFRFWQASDCSSSCTVLPKCPMYILWFSSPHSASLSAFWQGVPIRIELGPKDMESQSVMLARRDTGAKETVPWTDVTERIPQLLEQIQVNAFSTACHAILMPHCCEHIPSLIVPYYYNRMSAC